MRKNLVRTAGMISAMSMLAGCTLNPADIVNNNPITQITETVQNPDNNSPIGLSNETVSITKGVKGAEVEDIQYSDISNEQRYALTDASFKLLNRMSSDKPNDNILISPFSISMALGMTENGADGETLAQMEETVNGGISSDELDTIMYFLSGNMESSEDVDWNVANSIWFKDDGKWVMKDKFVKDVVTYYYPDMYKAPFNEQTVTDINAWVNNETNGMIPEILDAIPDDAVMYLVNAIAFEGEWATPYEDAQIYEDCTFTNCDGTTSQVTMLHSKENRYFTLGNGQGFIKPYKGRKYSFVAILPDEGVSTEEYLNNISAYSGDFAKDVREAGVEDVIVEMPEFTLDYDIELSDVYKSMGMDIPFDGQRADFTKMLTTASGEPYECWIGRILHKTHIEVDRKGTKAAAATVVEMEAKCTAEEVFTEPRQIILDRPFVYAIVDNETGMPIFLGCQNSFE